VATNEEQASFTGPSLKDSHLEARPILSVCNVMPIIMYSNEPRVLRYIDRGANILISAGLTGKRRGPT